MFKAGGIFCHALNMLHVQKNVSVTENTGCVVKHCCTEEANLSLLQKYCAHC